MVSSEQNYLFGVVDFECHDEGHDFDGVGAPVDVVALADVVQEQLELGGIVLLGKVGEILLQVDLVEGGNHRDRELVQHPDYLGHRPMEDL